MDVLQLVLKQLEKMDEMIQRVDSRLDVIETRQSKHDMVVEHHVKRCDALEVDNKLRYDTIHKEIQPIIRFVIFLKILFQVAGGFVFLSGLVKGVVEILNLLH